MKKPFLLFLPFLLFVAGAFVACEEVEEPGIYDNWQQRNEAFIDSIKADTGNNIVELTEEAANAMKPGELYAIPIKTLSTNADPQYVYCKILVANETGERPNAAGYHSTVSAYYYGTYITGDSFDGNFKGYGALDHEIPLPLPKVVKWPTEFDSPATFSITGTGVVSGLTWALQYMRTGERWILYIPWKSGYNSSDYTGRMPDGVTTTILGCSTLIYDFILNDVE